MENHCTYRFRRGDPVRVRSESEIRSTLGSDGTLEGLPFMPEMVQYCGQTLRVFRRAEKTCVEGCGIRRIRNTVLLEGVRCDGKLHAGCQRRCLVFWKEAWLEPTQAAVPAQDPAGADSPVQEEGTLASDDHFRCQSTQLQQATSPLPWWDLRQYFRELRLQEITLAELMLQFWILARNRIRRLFGKKRAAGRGSRQSPNTSPPLHLHPGELVEIRSQMEIEATLDEEGKNRGLEFTPDMAQYCLRQYRVAGRVEKIILECSATMRPIRDTVILEDLVCNGQHARNCPRANYYYWREAWLRRVDTPSPSVTVDTEAREVALAGSPGLETRCPAASPGR